MTEFEILCVTMNQTSFDKIKEMNIHSDVVFANQSNTTEFEQLQFEGKTAKMITTATRGTGINRNSALMYANAEICMFADDDLVYIDDMEEKIVNEFRAHPDADVIIFNLDTDDEKRILKKYYQTKKCGKLTPMPWGAPRVAFRLESIRKANIWFTTLFGGGCIFPSGEDSMWLNDAKRKGLTFYVSKETIGTVSFDQSTWFSGYNEKFFYAKGVYYQAVHRRTFSLWMLYFCFRTRRLSDMALRDKIKWMKHGRVGYRKMISYEEFIRGAKSETV